MPSYSSSGSVVTGTTSVAPVVPACNGGDMLVLHVETNGTAATTPSGGWIIGANLTVANSRRGVQYFKIAAGTYGASSTDAGTTVTVSGLTSGTTSTGVIDRIVPTAVGGVLSAPSGVAGTDTSITTTAYSATGGSSIAYMVGDLCVCSYVVTSTTAVLSGFTATALTAGANFGTSTNQRNTVQSSGAFMIGLQTATVTTAATSAPKMAGNGTGSATVGGVSQFLIIHEAPPMPAPVVQYAVGDSTGGSGPVFSMPKGAPTIGNLLLFFAGGQSSTTMPSNPSSYGFTLAPNIVSAGGNNGAAVYTKIADGTETATISMTANSEIWSGFMVEIAGADPGIWDGSAPSFASSTTGTPAANAATPSVGTDFALTFATANTMVGTAAGSPWSVFNYVNGNANFHGSALSVDANPTSGVALNSNWTFTNTGNTDGWAAITTLIKAAAVAAAPPPVIVNRVAVIRASTR